MLSPLCLLLVVTRFLLASFRVFQPTKGCLGRCRAGLPGGIACVSAVLGRGALGHVAEGGGRRMAWAWRFSSAFGRGFVENAHGYIRASRTRPRRRMDGQVWCLSRLFFSPTGGLATQTAIPDPLTVPPGGSGSLRSSELADGSHIFPTLPDSAMSRDGLMAEVKLKKSAPVLCGSSTSALREKPSFPCGSDEISELKTYPSVSVLPLAD